MIVLVMEPLTLVCFSGRKRTEKCSYSHCSGRSQHRSRRTECSLHKAIVNPRQWFYRSRTLLECPPSSFQRHQNQGYLGFGSNVSGRICPQNSDIHPICSFFNLFDAEKRTLAGSGAGFTNLAPFLLRLDVRPPKWPCSALDWSNWVDSAMTFFGVKKRAISVLEFR